MAKKSRGRGLTKADLVDAVYELQAHHLQIGREDFLRLAEERYDALEHRRARAAGGEQP
jgi:hypothetical protein